MGVPDTQSGPQLGWERGREVGRNGSTLGLLHTHTHTHTHTHSHTHTHTQSHTHTHTESRRRDCKDLKTPFILIKGNSKRLKGKKAANPAVKNISAAVGFLAGLSAAGTSLTRATPVRANQSSSSRGTKKL